MPTQRVNLFGSFTPRTTGYTANSDQEFVNCIFTQFKNPLTGASYVKTYKRPNWTSAATATGATDGKQILLWLGIDTSGVSGLITAFDATNSRIYRGSTLLGTITGTCTGIVETAISGTATCLFSSSDSTGWYYASDAGTGSPTFTANTNSNTTLNNISSTTGMYSGQSLSGTDIPAGTRILTVDSANSLTMTAAATGTSAGITVTRSSLAKIIDADFPGNASLTTVGKFAVLDGYSFIMTTTGRIYQSSLNSVTGWVSIDYLEAQLSPDFGIGVIKYRNMIVGAGKASIEFFRNNGNPTGSVLAPIKDYFHNGGITSANALIDFENTIAWVSSGQRADVGVFMMDGFTSKKISDAGTDLFLSQITSTDVYLAYAIIEGRRCLFLLSDDDEAISLVYDMDIGLWSFWNAEDTTKAPLAMATSFLGNAVNSYAVLKGSANIFQITGNASANSRTTTQKIITKPLDLGTSNRKFLHKFKLIGDHPTTGGNYTIQFSDDDFDSWSTARDINTANDNPQITRCGSFRQRSFRINAAGAANGTEGLEAMELEFDVGSS